MLHLSLLWVEISLCRIFNNTTEINILQPQIQLHSMSLKINRCIKSSKYISVFFVCEFVFFNKINNKIK